jgi:heavy metal sensor kinase
MGWMLIKRRFLMKSLSIGSRLTLWYVLIFTAAQSIFGLGMWLILRHNLYRIVNVSLVAQVDDMRNFLAAQKKKNDNIAKMQEEVSETYLIEHSGDYLQLSDSGGELIYRAHFLQEHPLLLLNADRQSPAYLEDLTLAGRPFRFIRQSFLVYGRTYSLQTGVPTDEVIRTLSILRRSLLTFSPIVLVLAAALGHALSRRALTPVDALTRTAQSISGENLSNRLEQLHTGDELQRLSDTLNRMLDRIESAFQRITQFTADASHELRTPVALMRAEAEVALRRPRPDSEYREALRHILLESERTTFLLEQLLSLARGDSGREALPIAHFNLAQTVKDTAAGWRQVASIRDLQFSEQVMPDELIISGDESGVRRVMNILLDNAVKYTASPGQIGLSLEGRDGKAFIAVCDSGIGIEEADREKVFERFYRVDKARSRELGGAGLGLSIAQWIVARHQGSISLESELGMGSIFRVELPLAPGTFSSSCAPPARQSSCA